MVRVREEVAKEGGGVKYVPAQQILGNKTKKQFSTKRRFCHQVKLFIHGDGVAQTSIQI